MQLAPNSQTDTANWYLITEHHDASLKIRSGIVLGCDHLNQLGLDSSREVIALEVSPMGHLDLRLVSDLFELRSEDKQSMTYATVEPGQAIQLRYLDTKLLLATDLAYVQKLDVLRLDLTPVATNLFNFPFKKSIFGGETNPEHRAIDVSGFGGVPARAGKKCSHWLGQLNKTLDPGLRTPLIAVTGFIVLFFVAVTLDRAQPADIAPTRSAPADADISAADSSNIAGLADLTRVRFIAPVIGTAEQDLVLGPIEYWNSRYPSSPLEIGTQPVVLAADAIDQVICIDGAFEAFEAFDAFDAFEAVPLESASLSQTQQSPDHSVSAAEKKYSQARPEVGLGPAKTSRTPVKISDSKGKPKSVERTDRISLNAKPIPLNTIGGFSQARDFADENTDGSGMLDASYPVISTISLPLTALTVISDKAPGYPRFRGKIDIDVEIRFTVDVEGGVKDLVTTGDPPKRFVRAATRAVRRWRFEPYVFEGRPTPVRTSVRFNFKS